MYVTATLRLGQESAFYPPGRVDEVDAWCCLSSSPVLVVIRVGQEGNAVAPWGGDRGRLAGKGLWATACMLHTQAIQDLRGWDVWFVQHKRCAKEFVQLWFQHETQMRPGLHTM